MNGKLLVILYLSFLCARPLGIKRTWLMLFIWIPLACFSKTSPPTFGIQEGQRGHVPARMAVLPCRPWPKGAKYQNLPLSNMEKADQESLCQAFDQEILRGFTNQPFMKGYSPKFILKLLEASEKTTLLRNLENHWQHQLSQCDDCTSEPEFYSAAMTNRKGWLLWLAELSTATKNTDAVLIPFLTYGLNRFYRDRGLDTAERTVGICILLIDTNNGNLIWAGGRASAISNKKLWTHGAKADLPLPAFKNLLPRLFIEDLWREFPGRQIF
jgi:hypothetical protein